MKLIPQGVILSCEKADLTSHERKFFSKTNPFGFILFSRNFVSKSQIKDLIFSLKKLTLNPNPYIFVDQEGGRVQRFKKNGFFRLPSQSVFGRIYEKNPREAKKLAFLTAKLIGCQLKEVGVDVNCSPVLDILFKYSDPIIGDRSFSSNPKIVSRLAEQYCNGYKSAGIIPIIKHFPGHGRARVDSHKTLPIVESSISCLKKIDLLPFMDLKDEIFMMLAHIVYLDIDNKVAPYSAKLKEEIINNYIKYKGLIISDDIDMRALKGSIVEKINRCYKGGCDIILYCSGKLEDMKIVYKHSKKINKFKFNLLKNFVNSIETENINKDLIIKYLRNSKVIA